MKTTNTSKWRSIQSAIFITLLLPLFTNAAIESFPLSQVRITGGPMAHAQQTNIQYLLQLDPDKLLAPYQREAGIKSDSKPYGNWESTGLDGHIGGHYLTALSLGFAATGNLELKRRLDYMIDQLAAAQDPATGYLSGIPDGKSAWQQIKQGQIKSDLFSLNDRWVPLYNIDKTYHGLRDAYVIGGNLTAKIMLIKLTDWMVDLTAQLSEQQVQQLLYSEHGGLAQVFVDVADITGDPKYLTLAKRFVHLAIAEPLLEKQDQLTGLHANTQIPKILGMLHYAQRANNAAWIAGADYFWHTVTGNRSVSIGGNSVREHFHDSSDFTAMIEDIEGPETCNTYNMMKLSLMLFKTIGQAKYFDFYERASYNHILSSQHPEHGGLVYFTSMRPGHYRTYSSVENSMWCCVGSGIENHSKYGEMIYAKQDDDLLINMYVPSTLDWQQQGVQLRTDSQFPDHTTVKITVTKTNQDNQLLTIKLRQPTWHDGAMTLRVNGKLYTATTTNGYLKLTRNWQEDDTIHISLKPKLYAEQLPDGQAYYSLLYGPVVLAIKINHIDNPSLDFIADSSRMGHIAAGPTCPPEVLPIMLASPNRFIRDLKKHPTELAFSAVQHVGMIGEPHASATTLIPFYKLHDSRYQIYWPQLDLQEFSKYGEMVKAKAADNAAIAQITIDYITPGQQQPEVEHNFAGEQTRAGVNNGHHWRDASGWFSYLLNNQALTAKTLRLKYFKHDVNREFDIVINDQVLTTVELNPNEVAEEFYYVDYPLTIQMQQAPVLTVKFVAKPGSIAGGLYSLRLINTK